MKNRTPASEAAAPPAATADRGLRPPFNGEQCSLAYLEDLSAVEDELCRVALDLNDRGVAEIYRSDLLNLLAKHRAIAAGSSVDSPPAESYPHDDTAVPLAAFDRAAELLRSKMLRLPGGADDMRTFVRCLLDWAAGFWTPPGQNRAALPPDTRKLAGALSHLSRAEQWEIQALVLGRLAGSVEPDPDAAATLRGFARLAPHHQREVLEHLGGILAADGPPVSA